MKELSKSNLRKDVQQSEAADSQLQRLIGSIQATQSATSSETSVSISIQKHNPGGVAIRDGYNFGNKPDIASIRSVYMYKYDLSLL